MKISAALIAGGESRRMGRNKATIVFQGKPLWHRQVDLLKQICPLEIMVSARTDPAWRPGETNFVADAFPSRGPLGGLAAAIAAMRGTHLLAVAIDMPFMTSASLHWMCGLIGHGRGVVPRIGSREEPLAAIYPRESAAHIAKALEGDNFSVRHLVDQLVRFRLLSIVDVPAGQERLFRSVNTPDELVDFQKDAPIERETISY